MSENYAVIANGGKQYRVSVGEKLKLESFTADEGDTVSLGDVLLVAKDQKIVVGEPTLPEVSVMAEVLAHGRHPKIEIVKFKRRKHYMKKAGHRQDFTEVKIVSIDN